MRRVGAGVVALLTVQVALLGGYLVVERTRRAEVPFRSEVLAVDAPAVPFEGRNGPVAPSTAVVHFWATWCEPCREELPDLLAASAATGATLVAATDEPWPVLERYFEGNVPDAIVRDPGGRARAAYEVSGLPDTFAVRGGRIVGRVGGPRDWSTPAARRFLGAE